MIAAQFSRDEMIRYDGLEKGLEIATKNFTINMYKNNFTLEQISKAAGISIEEVKEIISSN